MATLRQIIEEKNERLNSVPDEFLSKIERVQKKIFTELLAIIDPLERKGGLLVADSKNLNRITDMIEELRGVLATSEYPEIVTSFVDEFGTQKFLNDEYFKKAFTDFKSSSFADAVLKKSQDDAIQAFLGSPIDKEFLLPIESLLTDAVGSAGSWKDTVQNIRAFTEGEGDYDGKLLRYSKQIAHDRFAISDRSYQNAVNDELKTEWYLYSGSTIETSRCFCVERHQKYYHWKEIRDWGEGKDLGECEYNGLWQGAFASTNGTNIFLYAGGANCRHNLLGVSIFDVPPEVIERNIENGNYEPDAAEREALGLSDSASTSTGDQEPSNNEVKAFMADAKKISTIVQAEAVEIAERYGAKVTPINLKSEESIIRKATTEYGGNLSEIKDAVRNTIVTDRENILSVISDLERSPMHFRTKIQDATKDPLGYSGTIVNIKKDGIFGEIQVNTAKMIYAKQDEKSARKILGDRLYDDIKNETGMPGGKGHKFYEEWRLSSTTPERRLEIERESREYYSHFLD